MKKAPVLTGINARKIVTVERPGMANPPPRFVDRADAGRQLAARLADLSLKDPVVYALPRGGIPVALEIARLLHAPLEIVLVRKIGAPGAPEWALGALVEGSPPEIIVNEDIRRLSGASDAFLARARERASLELERRRSLYLGDRTRIDPAGRDAIIVDDGLATGATARAALAAIGRRGPARTLLAIPVAPKGAIAGMAEYADEIVCLRAAAHFDGVGSFYDDFHQLTDEEAVGLLQQGWSEGAKPSLG